MNLHALAGEAACGNLKGIKLYNFI